MLHLKILFRVSIYQNIENEIITVEMSLVINILNSIYKLFMSEI